MLAFCASFEGWRLVGPSKIIFLKRNTCFLCRENLNEMNDSVVILQRLHREFSTVATVIESEDEAFVREMIQASDSFDTDGDD